MGLYMVKMSAEILISKELGDDTYGGCAFAKESLCAEASRYDRFNLHHHVMKHMLSVSDAYCSRVNTTKLLKTI